MTKVDEWDSTETAVGDIEVTFQRSGYYDPGQVNGDPDDCRAPEGDEQREIIEILIDGKKIDLLEMAGHFVNFMWVCGVEEIHRDEIVSGIANRLEEAFFQPIADSWEP